MNTLCAFTTSTSLRVTPSPSKSFHTQWLPSGCPTRPTRPSHFQSRHSRRVNPTRTATYMGLFDLWQSEAVDPNSPPKFGFSIGYTYLAHPEKDTGEDAFFVEGTSIGVFDGVSGASETSGVDPRMYSQRLASDTCSLVKAYGPAQVVKAAIEASLQNNEIGASTACIVGMDNVGRLFGVNLGDSGVRLIRGGKIVFRTKEQQHFFNCPYQLGTDSEDGYVFFSFLRSPL